MAGIIYSIVGGLVIAIQGVMNTRISEKAGIWLTTTYVHFLGFLISLVLYLLLRGGSLGQLLDVNKVYMIGGTFGVVIIFTITESISRLGPTYSVAIVLVTQLIVMFLIDSFGLLGSPQTPFEWNRIAGIAVMLLGIVIFKR